MPTGPTCGSRCSPTSTRSAISETRADPGGAPVRPHVHRRHAESFYVLEGELRVRLGDREVTRRPRAVAADPARRPARPRARRVRARRFLNLHAPSCGFGDFVRALRRPAATPRRPRPVPRSTRRTSSGGQVRQPEPVGDRGRLPRLRTSSLARIRDTWTLAVFSAMKSCAPIWRFVAPRGDEREDLALARGEAEGVLGGPGSPSPSDAPSPSRRRRSRRRRAGAPARRGPRSRPSAIPRRAGGRSRARRRRPGGRSRSSAATSASASRAGSPRRTAGVEGLRRAGLRDETDGAAEGDGALEGDSARGPLRPHPHRAPGPSRSSRVARRTANPERSCCMADPRASTCRRILAKLCAATRRRFAD